MTSLINQDRDWATPQEVSNYLSVSKKTVYRLAEYGDLLSIKIRGSLRISVPGLKKYIHTQQQLRSLELEKKI